MNQISSATTTALENAAALFRNAKRIVALAPSGIPDFRSEGTGLWSSDEPMALPTIAKRAMHG